MFKSCTNWIRGLGVKDKTISTPRGKRKKTRLWQLFYTHHEKHKEWKNGELDSTLKFLLPRKDGLENILQRINFTEDCYPKYKTNVLKFQSNKQWRNKLKTERDTSTNKMFRLQRSM